MNGLFVAVVFVLITSEDLIFRKEVENGVKTRRKRSFICRYGLTTVLKEAILAVLADYQKSDPLDIGDTDGGNLKEGVLKGLSTLETLSDLEVYCVQKSLLVFTSAVGMRDIEVSYKWTYKILFEFGGTLQVNIDEINIEYEIHLNTTNMVFQVERLVVSRLDGFHVGFTGLGFLNPVVRGTMRALYVVQKGKAREKIELHIREEIEKKLSEIPDTLSFVSLLDLFI